MSDSMTELAYAEMEYERECWAALEEILDAVADVVEPLWRFGDGAGGAVLGVIAQRVAERHPSAFRDNESRRKTYIKKTIAATVRRQVFERDAYRCVTCGGWDDLTADHIVPESKGGPTSLENLQTMCRSCNSSKGARG